MSKEKRMEIRKWEDLSEREKERADAFILQEHTNGEFINAPSFLDYHPAGRFWDDSVLVMDKEAGDIKAVMMAARKLGEEHTIVSHPGTTFAGPVLDRRLSMENVEEVLDILLSYYEKRYRKIELKLPPVYYPAQPYHTLDYFLLRRGYVYGMTGLANILRISKIQTEEDILKMFNGNKRNHVKKALKTDAFTFYESAEIKESVWENMNQNLETKFQSKTTHTLEEIRKLQEKFPQNIISFYADSKTGDYGAYGLAFCFQNVFHTQYLDVNYAFSGSYPNLYLILKMIQRAREMGYDYFSFGASTEDGGNILNYGLYHYKAGYGGGDVLLPLYTWEADK